MFSERNLLCTFSWINFPWELLNSCLLRWLWRDFRWVGRVDRKKMPRCPQEIILNSRNSLRSCHSLKSIRARFFLGISSPFVCYRVSADMRIAIDVIRSWNIFAYLHSEWRMTKSVAVFTPSRGIKRLCVFCCSIVQQCLASLTPSATKQYPRIRHLFHSIWPLRRPHNVQKICNTWKSALAAGRSQSE